jgi:hypothetical protein
MGKVVKIDDNAVAVISKGNEDYWEPIFDTDFKPVEFDAFKSESDTNGFSYIIDESKFIMKVLFRCSAPLIEHRVFML